jgi:hypothetical protein
VTFVRRERARLARRVDPRAPERLVRVDVAHPHHEPLVHQRLLTACRAPKKVR